MDYQLIRGCGSAVWKLTCVCFKCSILFLDGSTGGNFMEYSNVHSDGEQEKSWKWQHIKIFRINSYHKEGNNMPINQSSIELSHKRLHTLGGPVKAEVIVSTNGFSVVTDNLKKKSLNIAGERKYLIFGKFQTFWRLFMKCATTFIRWFDIHD